MFVLMRAITYATFFIGFFLLFVPVQVLRWTAIGRPDSVDPAQVAGVVMGIMGAVLVVWCIGAFVHIGRGTPAPFDAPRQLVVRGPYRLVRNPMYIGASLTLAGAALFYESWPLLGYCVAFALITHLLVVLYEEPVLRLKFGEPYAHYCETVRRWWPRRYTE